MNEEQVKKNFALRLASLRKSAGMTQIQLAESLNYSDKAVSKWERAESIPDAYTLLKIAKLFSVPLDALFYGDYYSTAGGSRHSHERRKRDPATRRTLHVFIPLISIFGTYFISTVVYFIAKSIPFVAPYAPIAFVLGTLASFIILTVFSAIWWRKIFQFLSISGIIWTAGGLIAIILPFLKPSYIFIPCLILELICVLVYAFVYRLKKTKQAATSVAESSSGDGDAEEVNQYK